MSEGDVFHDTASGSSYEELLTARLPEQKNEIFPRKSLPKNSRIFPKNSRIFPKNRKTKLSQENTAKVIFAFTIAFVFIEQH